MVAGVPPLRVHSTLIIYKGEQEAGRSAGEDKPEAISALFDKAI